MDNITKTDFIHLLLKTTSNSGLVNRLFLFVNSVTACNRQTHYVQKKLLQITWDDGAIATNETSITGLKSYSPD